MKHQHVILTFLAAGSSSMPLPGKRDTATMKSSMFKVQTAVEKVDAAVKALSPDAESTEAVLSASNELRETLNLATSEIQSSQVLSLEETIGLQEPAGALIKTINLTLSDLVTKKLVLDQLGISGAVLQDLEQQRADTGSLGDAIVDKVPEVAQDAVRQTIGSITRELDSSIDTLKGERQPPQGPLARRIAAPAPPDAQRAVAALNAVTAGLSVSPFTRGASRITGAVAAGIGAGGGAGVRGTGTNRVGGASVGVGRGKGGIKVR